MVNKLIIIVVTSQPCKPKVLLYRNNKPSFNITSSLATIINDGEKTTLGKPYIKGASIKLKVLAHRRGQKIIVYKMRPKKKTRKKSKTRN